MVPMLLVAHGPATAGCLKAWWLFGVWVLFSFVGWLVGFPFRVLKIVLEKHS